MDGISININPSALSAFPKSALAQDDMMEIDEPITKPSFNPIGNSAKAVNQREKRKIRVPPHRLAPLKKYWLKIYTPIVEHLKLDIRMRSQTSSLTEATSALQKGADFIKAFTLGFDLDDSIALLRLDELYIDSFEIKDVKTLQGDHLSRAIGRLAGKDGKTKFAIENTTKTRLVIADTKIHILGSFQNIRIAKDAVCSLILGSPPGKVYANLRNISARLKERF
ncbi:pre-rRNA-processing protein pno1 [Entomophthora muscae]|uniref:Pre-rRNA-processing protein pno1 n=1 Tax=Entomophthora muscae TaxID=34485 RepID=A0ACC2UID1_9FUNG|nr:pre-rRNA-processing protein pno1 [Entomophthora muscae]